MQAIPIFPNLGLGISTRMEAAFSKMRVGQVAESAFVEFYNKMMQSIFEEITGNLRVKADFGSALPPLEGERMCFHIETQKQWTLEIVPVPHVLSFRLATEEEADKLPGFAGDFEIMKAMFVGAANIQMQYRAVSEGRLQMVNASPSNPAAWMRDLFALTGPAIARKDMTTRAVAKTLPIINHGLLSFGC